MIFAPSRAICAHRDCVSGFCSRPRTASPSNSKSTCPTRYSVAKTYPVGGDGGWDYLTFDTGANRVFISRGTHVMVMDAGSGKVVGDIPDTPGVHGIALAPELGRGFISSGRANSVTIFDLKDLHKIGEAKTGEGPEAIAYAPVSKLVFTSNARRPDT